MFRYQQFTILTLAAAVAGCAAAPPVPPQPTGDRRAPANSAAAISAGMAQYYSSQRLPSADLAPPPAPVKTVLAAAVQKYLPSDLKVFAHANVDAGASIAYDAQRPWAEALGDALAAIDVDMNADLDRRVVTLKRARIPLEDAIRRYVPPEFTAYAGEGIDMALEVEVDRSLPWSEALGRALAAVDLESTINTARKLVLIQRRNATESASGARTLAKAGTSK